MAASVGASFSWRSSSCSPSYYLRKCKPKLCWDNTVRPRPEQHQPNKLSQSGRQHIFQHNIYLWNQKVPKRQSSSFLSSSDGHSCGEAKDDAPNGTSPHHLANVEQENTQCAHEHRHEGKPGTVSFHGLSREEQKEALIIAPEKEKSSIFWFVGPAILVASLVFPSLYLRRIFSTIFEDSLLTDFLILFFTEALFYVGVAVFILLIDYLRRPSSASTANVNSQLANNGLRYSSVVTLVLSLTVPLVTMGFVWPWTGPAASATLAPYLVGLVVQFAFERFIKYRKSPALPVVQIIFQVYRLHQLNRAAQLVTALSYSVRGAEATPQTAAINSSLGTLLNVLQFLGVICIWSLATFLMRVFPSSTSPSNP